MKLPFFNYTYIREIPFPHLDLYSDHRRLRVFAIKGCKCVSCSREGTRLIQGKDNAGNTHVDLYTDDLHPMTVDHITPKAKGGSNNLDNLQPMCFQCNQEKGDEGYLGSNLGEEVYEKVVNCGNSIIGEIVFKVRNNGQHNQKSVMLGRVVRVGESPYNNLPSAVVDTGKESWFPLSKLYLLSKDVNSG